MSHDVAIVGGGPVGATLAVALGRAGADVVLVDAGTGPAPVPDDGFALRVSALSRASERVMRSLGVWDALPRERIAPFRGMRVWDAGGRGSVHFDSADLALGALGHIVENDVLLGALEARIAELANVRIHRPAVLEAAGVDAARAWIDAGGARIRARLVVGADGARSRVREIAGIEAGGGEFGQHAVVANVRTEIAHRDVAYQRFLPDGPLAFLPLPDGACSIVWSTSPEHARALVDAGDEAFRATLAEALERRLGAITATSARAAFPLAHLHAREYVRERVALVGDAAHSVHPLAGQGLNLGILDAAALAEVITGALARGRDPGRHAALRRYERWRRGHNALVGAALRGFKWTFGSRIEPVRVARNAGFDATDALVPLKRGFMRFACGLTGDLPALAREADLPDALTVR